MRDTTQLHPTLQQKIKELKALCAKNGITIGISECLRTVAEQNALYAKGRTAAGKIVTNASGTSYSSMHQWGVAFDFYLMMDVNKNGSIADDAFNDSTGLFEKVGKLGQSIGLEWGGSWKSIKDTPHFQLPNWGSTASKLKATYGTPDKFMKTWSGKVTPVTESAVSKPSTVSKSSAVLEAPKGKSATFNHVYITKTALNLRAGAGTNKGIIFTIPANKVIRCYGYYTKVGKTAWIYVAYEKYTGFVSLDYCKQKK